MRSLPASRHADASTAGALEFRPALEARIHAEFRELQGLRLSLAQSARLFGLDRASCLSVLESLLRKRVLKRDSQGNYCLAELDV